jgi:S-adenosylmethionine:tRNA ribosyltransferase-isomerase
MKVSEFDFELPGERIALRPAQPRDSARLLVVKPDANFSDHQVPDLPGLLSPGDVLVFNDTRVIPARLHGRRGQAKVQITLHQRIEGTTWSAFAKPAKRLHPGNILSFDTLSAEVLEKRRGGEVVLRFRAAEGEFMAQLAELGEMPLPPYIAGKRAVDASDAADYQTIFAAQEGAVAAPTAGLHFTPRLLAALADREIGSAFVTLHVGAGTFLPVRVEDTADHVMHAEWGEISAATAEALNTARAAGGRIVAVGTTALRLLESAVDADGLIRPFAGPTDIFIAPGYAFRAIDLLLTNFHLPRSTLFMLVAAFSGLKTMCRAYAHAIDRDYRFYSYGDACLLYPHKGTRLS